MTVGNGPEALESELTLPSDDSRPERPKEMPGSKKASDQTDQTEPNRGPPQAAAGIKEALDGRGLSPEQIRKRARNQAYKRRQRLGLTVRRKSQSGKKHDSHKPLWSADQIRGKLRQYDRTPFLDLLSAWLECSPTPEALLDFADRYPDRYASSLLSIGRIAGFAERREISADISGKIQVEHLSDSQLEDKLRELAYEIGIPVPKIIELQALPGSPGPTPEDGQKPMPDPSQSSD